MGVRTTKGIGPALLAFIAIVALPVCAFAWKPNTHVYIANLILADARDGKVWIPPFGEFNVSPDALSAIQTFPDTFRAGSVGPDGFPDIFTGQLSIHPNTDAWLSYMWSVMKDEWRTTEGWAFLFGFLTHCGGDMWCHDWVNYYAGGPWQGLSEFETASHPSACAMIDTRHLAIEATLNRQVNPSTKTIRLPTCEFVYKYLVIDPRARALTIFPFVDRYVGKYWEKYPSRDKSLSYDAAWFEDLEDGLKAWVAANETAWKNVVERGDGAVGSLTSSLGEWALIRILDMEGLPSVTRWTAEAVVAALKLLPASAKWALNLIGLDEQTLQNLQDEFVDAMLTAMTDMTADQWSAWMNGEVNSALFPPDTLAKILSDIGTIPAESQWVHSNANASQFAQFINGINGPLYNSVITGKLALLPASEIDRMTGGNFYVAGNTPNVLLGMLRSIDQGRQWSEGLHQWWLGAEVPLSHLRQNPKASAFYYLFKPYPPVQQYSVGPLYSPTNPPAAVQTRVAGRVATYKSPLEGFILWRKASDTTGPWQSMRTASDGTFEWPFPPDFQTSDYYLRAVHSRYNFAGPVLLSHSSPNLNQVLAIQASSAVPTPSVGPRFGGTTRNKAFVTYDCLPSTGDLRNPFGVVGNSIGLPSSFPLKLGSCQVVKTASGAVAGGGAYLTGMTGKVFIMGDYTYSWSIVPPVQTVVDFTIDLDGNARWGCTNLAQAVLASDTLTVNVGGHPGTLAVEICLNWSPPAVAGARISHGYRAVRNALGYYTAGELNAAEVQGLRQALDNLPLTIGTPATAEARMREAVSRVTHTQIKEVLGRTFDIALGQFPTLAAGEQWELLGDEIRCTVQPNVTQADSHAVAPSLVVAPPRPRFTDTLRQQSTKMPVSATSPGLAQKPAPAATTPVAPSGTRVDGAPAATTPPASTPTAPSGTRVDGAPVATTPAAAKPAAPSSIRIDDAAAKVFGVPHTLGRASPVTFTLNNAEYSVTPVRNGEEMTAALAVEKLLVVHYTLSNPNPGEITVSWGFLTFTAVDREGAATEPSDVILMEKTGEAVDTVLRPNQTLDAYTILTLPAKGGIETLVIDGDNGSSLEIDIGSAVKPLPAAVADPADPSGFTALAEVAVLMATSCPLGSFGVLVEKAQYSAGPIIKTTPGKGARFLVLTLAISNGTPQVQPVNWSTFAFALRLADGTEIAWNDEFLQANRDELIDQTLGPGKQLKARLFFEVPAGAEVRSLYAREGEEGRAYLVNLAVAK